MNDQEEVDRHIAWARVPDGPTPQRARSSEGGAESVFLAHGWMLTLLAGDYEGDEEQGTWFWGVAPDSRELFEFTIPYGDDPTDEQRRLVSEFMTAAGTDLPFRLNEGGWPTAQTPNALT